MKKIIGIAAIAALIATSAFADGITVSGWGRGLFFPAAGNGKEIVSGDGTSWTTNLPRVGFTIAGSTEYVGFQTDWTGENGGVGDQALMWVKPFKMLKVVIGRAQDDTLRGNADYGLYDWARIGFGWTGEDVTFTRLGNGTGGQLQGAIIMLDPIEGLHIAGGVNVQDNVKASDNFGQYGQYQIGYTIKNIGTVKAQYIGKTSAYNWDGEKVNYGVINGAFDLTAVQNLLVSVGAYIPTSDTYTSSGAQNDVTKVNGYIRYGIDALTVHGLFCSNINVWDQKDTTKHDMAFGFAAGLGVNYDLGNGLGLVGDVRYSDKVYNSKSSDGTDCLVFLAAIEKGFSNGKIGIGFEGGTNCAGPFTASDADTDAFTWAIPVKIEYWF
jgi:hypothetical protein